jgi:hypothetical protein
MVVRSSGTKNRLYTHIIVYSHLHKKPFRIFLKITSVMGASIVSDKKLNSEIENVPVFEKLFLRVKAC